MIDANIHDEKDVGWCLNDIRDYLKKLDAEEMFIKLISALMCIKAIDNAVDNIELCLEERHNLIRKVLQQHFEYSLLSASDEKTAVLN